MSRHLPLSVRTWLHLGRVTDKIARRLTRQLAAYHLTPAQFDVLVQLQRAPSLVQQELADRLFVTKGNIVGVLNRMERDGFVRRQPHPEDGRAHLVCLTERGMQLADQVVPEHEACIDAYLSVLSLEDRQCLHDVLRRLNRALGAE
jgi:MarR family transcriptional regulator, organic hydroperoxide resistance regulator